MLIAIASPIMAQTPSAEIPEPVIEGGRLGPAYAPLIERLRSERLILLFRHDRTETTGRWDFEPYVAGSCEQQRGLSEAGRASARAIGMAVEKLNLPVRRVISSTYCRAVESARLMFGGVHKITPELIGPDGKMRDYDDVLAEVTGLIENERPKEGLLVLLGHHGTIDAVTTRLLDEGDALVLHREDDGTINILAHIPAARWDEIARDVDRAAYEPD
ncbi:hypothetical protein [Erythrobacter sp. QSSC1-22B]|uniref:hypothetical protein n=1 Tax=Erythrobacter sp. QSSC1-22B TaxID=1860125 RepID=UPI001F2862C3|nr:hypothetical protein [Erythrobacter sp. QSSC1-22B]